MQFVQQIQVNIRYQNHFGVRSCLCPLSVRWKSKVAWGKHTRLSVLNIHIVHTGKISDTSGNDHKTFILDGTCLRTNTNTGIGILGICQEMYEKLHVTPDEIKSWGLNGGKLLNTFDTGKISDTSGNDYKTFILDGTCLRTDTNTGIGILGICQERNK